MSVWQKYISTEVHQEFMRSRGVGGQHVNKTESAVVLRWSVPDSRLFTDEQKQRLKEKLASRLTTQFELLVRSEVFRDRDRNIKDAFAKLIKTIEIALHVPKARKKTKPTRSSQKKRLETKKSAGEQKKLRQKIQY